jgi:hypothetical protein
MSKADIIVGHNLDNADVPWLKGDFYLPRIGHPHRPQHAPLPPFKTVDTLKVLRQQFKSGAPFKSLDAFCKIVGIPAKTDKYDRDAMERAVAGSVEDRLRLTDYCAGDVIAPSGSTTGSGHTSRTIRRCSLTGRTSSRPATAAATRRSMWLSGTSRTC